MSILIFTPDRNVEKNDYKFAFKPEAARFIKERSLGATATTIEIDVSKPPAKRLQQVVNAIEGPLNGVSGIAFFCHGWSDGIQLGINNPKAIKSFAEAVASCFDEHHDEDPFEIPLYCCSTASSKDKNSIGGDGGFADRLRDALCTEGLTHCSIDAHTVKGHTTGNPYVRRFEGAGSPVGGAGGSWIVAPKSQLWKKWVSELDIRNKKSTLRYRFPYMPVADIHKELLR